MNDSFSGEIEHDEPMLCACCFNRSPEDMIRRAHQRREAELVAFRARRAKRIIELGLGSHRPAEGAR